VRGLCLKGKSEPSTLLLRREEGAPASLRLEGHVTGCLPPEAELKRSPLAINFEGDRLIASRSLSRTDRDALRPIVCLKVLAAAGPKEEISSGEAAPSGEHA
jgi:hypothetical protein